jgi:glycosyltransferase involved in cell wall biosynthesis
MPKVSVIIPNYNHQHYLTQRIESVLAQTFQDFELIILDDRSTDASRSVIEKYWANPKVSHIVYNEINSGSTFKQWEKGFKLAQGEWIWIAESDDYSEEIFLQSLIYITHKYDNIGIAFSNSHWVDDESRVGEELSLYHHSFFRPGISEVKDELTKHCTIQNASSCLIKREYALKAIQGLGKYRACGDWIFYTRVLQFANLAYTDRKLNYFRWYHQSVSSLAKEKLWTTEGIDVLRNINYNRVSFTSKEFFGVLKMWLKKIRVLKLRDSFGAWMTIFYSIFKFYTSRKPIKM